MGLLVGPPGLLDSAVSLTYQRVLFRAGGLDRVLPLGRYRYHVVRRPDLSAVVRRILLPCPGFEFLNGTVEHVAEDGTVTVDGRRVNGAWVFDSVTGPAGHPPVDARLAFTGWAVRCARPVFDPAIFKCHDDARSLGTREAQ